MKYIGKGNECAKLIVQSGIRHVLYCEDKKMKSVSSRASRILFHMAGIKFTNYIPDRRDIVIDFHLNPRLCLAQPLIVNKHPTKNSQRSVKPLDILEQHEILMNEANYDCLQPTVQRRKGYLTWDDYFMAVACLSAQRSKDPNTQVGCCLVDENLRVIGIGYNGFPRGCSDEYLPWARNSALELNNKYPFVVHAEVNAILNKGSKDIKGATLYVDLFPCNECAKVIIQSGIREIVYVRDIYHDTDASRGSRILFQMTGVAYRQHLPSEPFLLITLKS